MTDLFNHFNYIHGTHNNPDEARSEMRAFDFTPSIKLEFPIGAGVKSSSEGMTYIK